MIRPKCHQTSGNSWSQCEGACPVSGSPHYKMESVTRTGYLKKDRQERFNLKRGWFVNAWRIVDAQGHDMVQPWANTKTETRRIAKALGIELIED